VTEQRLGHRPTLVDAADDVLFGHLHVVEEGVAERGRVSERLHRLDLDAGALQVNQEEGDTRLLLRLGIRPDQAEDPIGILGIRGPSLLSVDHEVIACVLGGGTKGGQVAARARLGIALAPELFGAQDLR
jgi:hypothetical protein